MLYRYYENGRIEIPNNIEVVNKSILSNTLNLTLSKMDYNILREGVKQQIDNRYYNLSKGEKQKTYDKLIKKLEYKYYHNLENGVSFSLDKQYCSANKKISIIKDKLTKEDYKILYEVADLKIKSGLPFERETIVDNFEREFFKGEKIIIPRIMQSKSQSNNLIFSAHSMLNNKDYEIINKVVVKMTLGKTFINEKKRAEFISRKIYDLEKNYNLTGKVVVPQLEEANSKFKSLNIEYLTPNDYLNFDAMARESLANEGEEVTSSNIQKIVDQYEYRYYKYGKIEFEESKSKINHISKRLAMIGANYVMKDLPEAREFVQVGQKGIYVGKSVRSLSRSIKASKLAANVAKSIIVRSVGYAIPVLGVVYSVGDVMTSGVRSAADRR